MPRFAGIKDDKIHLISSVLLNYGDYFLLEIPKEFDNISSGDLISNFRYKNNELKSKSSKKNANEMKVAFVSNWKMKCGISTYAECLLPEVAKYVGDFKLFIEKNDIQTENVCQFGDQIIPENKVVACWQRNESLQELVKEIHDYDPDVVIIQHEFGIWPNARYWLSLMTQLSDYRVIVVMHSVFPHHYDKMIYEASMPEIIVHLEDAKHNLQNIKKVNAKVHTIGHGCYKIEEQKKLWNNYKSQHTFIQQGFGFKYKNFEASIKATAILKDKYPDVFFTGLFSESPHNGIGHQIYYNDLKKLINDFDLQENVAIIRGYQQDNIVDSFLRSNQVAVFPYLSVPGHEVYGASGAARLAMSKGIPIISSSIPHFSDLNTIKADTPEEIAFELDKLFCDEKLRKNQVEKQNNFIVENSWDNVAKRYVSIIESE